MAQVELPQGIVAIHGKIGNMIYRSRKQPDGTYRVFVHEAPSRRTTGKKAPSAHQSRTKVGPTSRDKACEQ